MPFADSLVVILVHMPNVAVPIWAPAIVVRQACIDLCLELVGDLFVRRVQYLRFDTPLSSEKVGKDLVSEQGLGKLRHWFSSVSQSIPSVYHQSRIEIWPVQSSTPHPKDA